MSGDCEAVECPEKGSRTTCVIEQRLENTYRDADPLHFSLFNFSRLVASQCEGARMPIIVLNLANMSTADIIESIQFIARHETEFRHLAAAAHDPPLPPNEEPLLLELGNEFYLDGMYACKFGNTGFIYADKVKEVVPAIRAALPTARECGV